MRLTMHGCYRVVDTVSLVSNVAHGSFGAYLFSPSAGLYPLLAQ
jgi:hypothetical protein